MSLEREDITVRQSDEVFILRTEQTYVSKEIFPSRDDAIRKKNLEKWRDTFSVYVMPSAGVISAIEGLRRIYEGYQTRNFNEMWVGGMLLYLGFQWIAIDTSNSVNRKNLAKRQLEKFNSNIDFVASTKSDNFV